MLHIHYETKQVLSFETFLSLSETFDSVVLSKPKFGLNEPLFDDEQLYHEPGYVDTHMMLNNYVECQVSLGGEEFSFVTRDRNKMTPFRSARTIQNNGLFYKELLKHIGHLLWMMVHLNKKQNYDYIWFVGHDTQQKRFYETMFRNKNVIDGMNNAGYVVKETSRRGIVLEKK